MDRMTYVYIGFAPMFILFMLVSFKKLRSGRLLGYFSVFGLILAVAGFLIETPEAMVFSGSFFYVIIYTFFRGIYLRVYNREPTYNRGSWYDPEEGRKQNWLDVVTFVVPLFLSFLIPLYLVILKAEGKL